MPGPHLIPLQTERPRIVRVHLDFTHGRGVLSRETRLSAGWKTTEAAEFPSASPGHGRWGAEPGPAARGCQHGWAAMTEPAPVLQPLPSQST